MPLAPHHVGRKIKEVRETLNFSLSDVATALGLSEEAIARAENGDESVLTGDYVLALSRLLKADFRIFVTNDLDAVENEVREVFRAMQSPSREDRLAIRKFVSFATAEHELEVLLGHKHASLPPTYPLPRWTYKLHKEQGLHAAIAERTRLGLGLAPIENPFGLLRTQGVRLFRYSLSSENISGVTIVHPLSGICVLINYFDDIYRQFFSTAHEYCHVLFDRKQLSNAGCVISARFNAKELVEIRANSFAAEFLLPREAVAASKRPKNSDEVLQSAASLARIYRVNTLTVILKMQEIGWITPSAVESFKKKPVVIPRKEKFDPDQPKDLTSNQLRAREAVARRGISNYYLGLLSRSLVDRKISFGRFAELVDLSPPEAWEFVSTGNLAID